jgi:hypothetical protein
LTAALPPALPRGINSADVLPHYRRAPDAASSALPRRRLHFAVADFSRQRAAPLRIEVPVNLVTKLQSMNSGALIILFLIVEPIPDRRAEWSTGYWQGEATALAVPASRPRDGDVSLRGFKGWKSPLQSERTDWPRSADSGHSRASHVSDRRDTRPLFPAASLGRRGGEIRT